MAVRRSRREARSAYNDGQATVEYILLLAMVVAAYATIAAWVNQFGLVQKMMKPITTDFANTYRNGDPQAQGYDSDSPKRHPRMEDCEECFRIFMNPGNS